MNKCLLQDLGGDGYRVHDLVLEFVKNNIKEDADMVEKATAMQAQHLRRMDVVKGYTFSEHGACNQGLYVLGALWRSAEELSGDPGLEVASYRASLGELDSCEATVDVAECYSFVERLFYLQVG